MTAKKVTTKQTKTTKTTKTAERDRDMTAEIVREYLALSPHNQRALDVAVLMLSEGASRKLTTAVVFKLADAWGKAAAAECKAAQ